MSISVKDVLSLDLLKDARIVAGKKGLSREVLRVNFTDCPLDKGDPGYSLVTRGDLYIHSFYIDYEDENKVYDIINFYIETGSSCCIALDCYLKEFPEKVKKLAEKHHYPIVMIGSEIPYASLIQTITELIMVEQLDLHTEIKLNRLLYETLPQKEIQDILSYLVPVHPKRFACLFVNFTDITPMAFRQLKTDLSTQFQLRLLSYQKGGFVMIDLTVYKNFDALLHTLLRIFSHIGKNDCIGISSFSQNPASLSKSFREALDAAHIGQIIRSRITYYEEVPLYNLLLLLKDHAQLQSYCEHIFRPLRLYEEQHSVDLIDTLVVYFELNGDVSKTAARLNIHVNTVRFRIKKAQHLLGMEEEPFTFIEQVSIALKGSLLLKQDFK